MCSTWPTSEAFSCTEDGGGWKSLDNSLGTSQTSACQQLCVAEGENGCCYLSQNLGCYWKVGAGVYSIGSGIAVECIFAGTRP